jgi:hypothetical protein
LSRFEVDALSMLARTMERCRGAMARSTTTTSLGKIVQLIDHAIPENLLKESLSRIANEPLVQVDRFLMKSSAGGGERAFSQEWMAKHPSSQASSLAGR